MPNKNPHVVQVAAVAIEVLEEQFGTIRVYQANFESIVSLTYFKGTELLDYGHAEDQLVEAMDVPRMGMQTNRDYAALPGFIKSLAKTLRPLNHGLSHEAPPQVSENILLITGAVTMLYVTATKIAQAVAVPEDPSKVN